MLVQRTRIPNGATVEIISDDQAAPQPSWLNFTITGKARSHIRNWLRQQKVADRLLLGRNLFDQALHNQNSSLEAVDPDDLAKLLQTFKLENIDALFLAIAQGEHCSRLLSQRLLAGSAVFTRALPTGDSEATPLLIKGTDGLLVHFSRCCYPLPKDHILAHLNPDKGLEVHRDNCSVLEANVGPESILSVGWAEDGDSEQSFLAGILTQAHNVPGVIFRVAEQLQQMKVNIEEISTDGENSIQETKWIIRVRDLEHLSEIIRLVEHVSSVIRVKRIQSKAVDKEEGNYFRD